ncbi:MAG TPA: tyrosine-type recombinase/integrase [Candidatus Acidoferrales bacterium]|nr:tyrosine-type recombinase/integrase [Candidatus Acidoferrales bacterium]
MLKYLQREINPRDSFRQIAEPEASRTLLRFAEKRFAQATRSHYASAMQRIQSQIAGELGEKRIPLPTERRPEQRITRPAEDEVQSILARAEPAMRVILLLCADCGLRTGEARAIAPEHFDGANITFRQKGHSTRSTPVTARLAQMLREAPDVGDRTVPYAQLYFGEKQKFSEAVMHSRWRALQKVLGLNSGLRMHDFRRRLATKLYEATKDLRAAQAALGHQNLTSTLRYIAPFDPANLRGLMEDLKAPFKPKGENK